MKTVRSKRIKCPTCYQEIVVKGGVITCPDDHELPQTKESWHADDWAELEQAINWTANHEDRSER